MRQKSLSLETFTNGIQRPKESEEAFADELQILVRKIIARKLEFCLQANEALKHQYGYNLKDQYSGAIARTYLLTSHKEQIFTQFSGQLALMFGKRGKKDTKAHVTTVAISGESSPGAHRETMSCNPQKHQNKIDVQAAEITNMWSGLNSAQNESEKLRQAFHPSSIAHVISMCVNSLQTKAEKSSSSIAKSPSYAAKPYNGKPRPSQLSPRANGTLDLELTCYYCKDTSHRKNNCIWLNHKLACELQMTKGIIAQLEDTAIDTQPN